MPKYIEDQNGYVTFPDTPLSKPGVFPYLGREIGPELEPDRIYNVYRPESELNSAETIESFKLSPWFPRHEMAGDEFTSAEEIGVQGTTGQDVRYIDGMGLVATVKTFGTRLKAAIRSGMRELSCGFRCSWDVVSGTTPDGVKYDVIQRNIRGNHLASVEEGRMGAGVSVAMDRACIALDKLNDGETMELDEMLAKVRDAEPAKEELRKLFDEIKAMLGDHVDDMVENEPGEDSYDEDMDANAMDMDDDKAMDMDKDDAAMDEDDDKPKAAMDAMAKTIKRLEVQIKTLSGKALDAATIERHINDKNSLLKDLEPVVGKIDGTGLDAAGVAKKAAAVLGIACDSGSALASVRGYLHAHSKPASTIDRGTAQDSAASIAVLKTLDEAGL
jgi:hypothetical protein